MIDWMLIAFAFLDIALRVISFINKLRDLAMEAP